MTSLLIPEGILILTALLTVFVGVLGDQKWQRKIVIVPILGLSLAFLGSILATRPEASDVLSKTLILDSVSQFLKVIFILVALAVIVIGHLSREIEQQYKNEFYSLIILATLASCIIASAVHLLTLYMAYEMASLIFCLLCAFKRESSLTSEASMKLLVIGVATSLFFLLGLVLFFGLTQSLNILDIRAFIEKSQPSNLYLIVALGLIFVAIATRMSLFPFHLAGPDFIDGASVPTAAYLAVGPFLIGVVLAL